MTEQTPIYTQLREGNQENPYVYKNEDLIIDKNAKAFLTEFPERLYGVDVQSLSGDIFYETQEYSVGENEFRVDYESKTKSVTFHQSQIGQQLNFVYKGTGLSYLSPSQIYTELNSEGIMETLDVYIKNMSKLKTQIENLLEKGSVASVAGESGIVTNGDIHLIDTILDGNAGNSATFLPLGVTLYPVKSKNINYPAEKGFVVTYKHSNIQTVQFFYPTEKEATHFRSWVGDNWTDWKTLTTATQVNQKIEQSALRSNTPQTLVGRAIKDVKGLNLSVDLGGLSGKQRLVKDNYKLEFTATKDSMIERISFPVNGRGTVKLVLSEKFTPPKPEPRALPYDPIITEVESRDLYLQPVDVSHLVLLPLKKGKTYQLSLEDMHVEVLFESDFDAKDIIKNDFVADTQLTQNGNNVKGYAYFYDMQFSYNLAYQEVVDAREGATGDEYSSLKQRLDTEFNQLTKMIKRFVHVDDFGGVADGKTDNTQAFKDALAEGNVRVHLSAGTYMIKESIKMPSYSQLIGQGQGISEIKLSDDAPAKELVIVNADFKTRKNTHIHIRDLTVNGNKKRQGGVLAPAGGSKSSGIRLAGVRYSYIENVDTKSTLLHGIDITNATVDEEYPYTGDGNRGNDTGSQYIWIDNCTATDFGDDGFTTHHSDFLQITNCYSHHPTINDDGTGRGNNNGFEIDDGSRYVFLANNKSEECFGGIEIKGHADISAAQGIFVNGHTSIRDNRSYNFRHIGHHSAKDEESKTAYDIVAKNIVSLYPYENNVYQGSKSRALVVSSYKNVVIDGFTAIGDETHSDGQPVVAFQYRSENITFTNVNIRGFINASEDINIIGGGNRPAGVTLSNINIYKSAKIGISNGSSIYDTKISGASLVGNGGVAITSYNNTMQIIAVTQSGYDKAAKIAGRDYDFMPTVVKGGFSAASTSAGSLHETAAVIASTGASYAHDTKTWLLGVSDGANAYGSRAGILNSLNSETEKDGYAQLVFNSNGVKAPGNYQAVGGYGEGKASTANVKINLDTFNGNIKAAGTVTGASEFSDYGEYFESKNGKAIPLGTVVTLDGRFITPANKDDKPLGVISGTAGIILGENTYYHKDKYLKNEFGVTLYEYRDVIENHTNENGEKVERIVRRNMPVLNPDYNADLDEVYLSRSERVEWNVVGLLGQIYVRVDESVKAGDSLGFSKGIAHNDTNGHWQVMSVTTPFDTSKGYGVALVLVK